MEQVYRRRGMHTEARRRRTAEIPKLGVYKQTVLKQSLLCLMLFGGALFVKIYPDVQLEVARSSIQFILIEDTDFQEIPNQIREFFNTYILKKDVAGELGDKKPLMELVAPVDAPVASGFGLRMHPVDGVEKFHYGVDLDAKQGDKIKCAAVGEAVETGENPDYGNYILVRHSDSIYTFYAHCLEILPRVGDQIQAGQVIATVGDTGKTTGAHLHFEIRDGDTWLDPAEFVNFKTE